MFRWWGYFGTNVRTLIWGLSFGKCFLSIFFSENAFQIGLSIPEGIAPRTDQRERSPKRASDSKRAIKPGSRGAAPALFLPISREKWGPPPGRRGNGALRPEAPEKPRPPEGYAVPHRSPARGRAGAGLPEPPTQRARSTGLPLAGGRVGTGAGPSGNGRPEPPEEMPKAASPLGRPPWAMRCYFVVCFLPISKCSLTIYGNQYP